MPAPTRPPPWPRLDKLIADQSQPQVYRDLAVCAGSLLAGKDQPWPTVAPHWKRLPCRAGLSARLAAEQLAYLLIEDGKKDEAIAALAALMQDQDAPGGLRQRAAQMITALGGTPPEPGVLRRNRLRMRAEPPLGRQGMNVGVFRVMTSGKIGMAGLMLCIGLAGCEKDVILEGERFPVRAPLEDSLQVEGEPAPVAASGCNPPTPRCRLRCRVHRPMPTGAIVAAMRAMPRAMARLSGNPQRVFSVNIGSGDSKRSRIAASPVVSGGRVFTMDASARVTAVSTGGAALWTASIAPDSGDSQQRLSVAVWRPAATDVYATSGYGELVALDASTGGIAWRQRFDSPVTGAPTVVGNVVYAMGRDGSAAGGFSADTGKQVWQQPGAPNSSGMIGTASVGVDDDDRGAALCQRSDLCGAGRHWRSDLERGCVGATSGPQLWRRWAM